MSRSPEPLKGNVVFEIPNALIGNVFAVRPPKVRTRARNDWRNLLNYLDREATKDILNKVVLNFLPGGMVTVSVFRDHLKSTAAGCYPDVDRAFTSLDEALPLIREEADWGRNEPQPEMGDSTITGAPHA